MKLPSPTELSPIDRHAVVAGLRKRRPRDKFLRASVALVVLLTIVSWASGYFVPGDVTSSRRLQNLTRFLGEIRPYPLQRPGGSWPEALPWARRLLAERGVAAAVTTLAVAVASIVAAGALALVLSPPAARNLATPQPLLPDGRPPGLPRRFAWKALVLATRGVLTFGRAVPEYVWAFLLLAMLGPQAWPAVLALALHNAGILGRLGAEVIENTEPAVPRALRGLGSTRTQIVMLGLFPLVLPRLLLYFFYRWETCVREATVLGLLGFTSLGYWIKDARDRGRYDEMLLFILLGAVLVLLGDIASAVARRAVRRAA